MKRGSVEVTWKSAWKRESVEARKRGSKCGSVKAWKRESVEAW
eukprot:CAMPEP_0177665552 /NCGR_PEP_ID=MMETSP0447-20121125/21111_1 /TAXON_ID=0 /ORGANISM="Stygamoeba regulata, Strain BSH-02190019" /LENGTH=42 /DNA_ID= /DNA_START= /DNA_END= /DNA_ORIENTATION=